MPALPVEAEVVETDLACAGCRYNLRTIAIEGICPECAMPVRDSMTALARGDRRYGVPLSQERRGWLIAGGLSFFGLLVAAAALWMIPFNNGGIGLGLVIAALVTLSNACVAVCWWLIARPGRGARQPMIAMSWLSRAAMLASSAYAVFISLFSMWKGPAFYTPWVVAVFWILNGLATMAGFAWLALLAWRMRQRWLAAWNGVMCLAGVQLLSSSGVRMSWPIRNARILPDMALFGPIWNHGVDGSIGSSFAAYLPLLWLLMSSLTVFWFGACLLRTASAIPRDQPDSSGPAH
jgi:hypothetical protein